MGERMITAGIVVALATAIFWVSRPEGRMNGSVDALVAKLAADESWQDHMDERERKILLNWAHEDMTEALGQRFTHVLGRMRTVNATFPISDGWVSRAEALKAIVGLRE